MVDISNKKRKEFISEGDIATILQRYDTMTILKLLQEIAYYAKPKMDWNELVKKTTTGITNARDYQLLWRHLAYRDSLLPAEDDAQLLDDGSDMECELEASPAISVDAVAEAIAHVKVIAASYVPSESDIPEDSTVEAPLTINIPYGLNREPQEPSDSYWSSRGMNITFPVLLQKAAEGYNGNGLASGMASRKRRKKWSAEEDEELIAAVKRHGEGSWAIIAKEEFEGEITASKLSQRWGAIKRRCDISNSSTQSGLQRTEAQIAANRALSLAVGNRLPSKKLAAGTPPTLSPGSIPPGSSQGQQQSQPVVQALPRVATSTPIAKSRFTGKKTTTNSTSRAELMVTANSVAAAACMSGLATTATVPKVEPGKNVVATLVPKSEHVKTVSAASSSRPSSILPARNADSVKTTSPAILPRLSAPTAEPVKKVATAAATNTKAVGPLNIRPAVNGIPNHVISSPSSNKPLPITPLSKGSTLQNKSVPSGFASSRLAPTQRVPGTTVMPQKPNAAVAVAAPCKPVGLNKEQTQGNRASPLVTTMIQPNKIISANTANSTGKLVAAKVETHPTAMPKKNQVLQTEVGSCTDKSLLNKPPEKESSTTVTPLIGVVAESKPKDEASKGKSQDVATLTGTVKKGL